ncbi:MAG TPA: hypothetical protein VK550_19295 [Polyangiaceae bacterium]|nr:hypothetical protein [Polyangiaceae bacterium]
MARAAAWVCAAGVLACGATGENGSPAATGGAAGSDPSHASDASHGDGSLPADGAVVDSPNGEGTTQRDAPSTVDANGAKPDAPDGATTRDASLDGSIEAGSSDRSSGVDTITSDASANDAAQDPSSEIRGDVGTTEGGGACGCAAYGTPAVTGTEPTSLTELSGLVASRKNPGVIYAHNDSGSNSTIIVMSDVAAPLGQIVLGNVTAIDWEDIAVGPCDAGSCIFVGEIGDNNLAYASRAVYRFAEPSISPATPIGTQTVTADALTFVYPDGRHNAETLLVEPMSGDIFVVTKVSNLASTVYRMPKPFTPGTQTTMEKVGDLSLPGSAGLVTGGDVHPCGTRMLIRTYPAIYEFKLVAGQPFSTIFAAMATPVSTPTQDQESKGEGVTYAADGIGYFTASELDGKSSRSLFRVLCQ